jgi:hypothetical protein
MTDPRTPVDDLRVLAEELRGIRNRLDKLESPTGTSAFQSVAKMQATIEFLSGLQTYAGTSNTFYSGTVPDDETWYYFEPTPELVLTGIEIPTNRCIIEASLGSVIATPGGSSFIAGVTFDLKDANDVSIPGGQLGSDLGYIYVLTTIGASVSTGQQFVSIDPAAHPGPYSVRLYGAAWAGIPNTTACSATFNDPALTLRVIENGSWL